MRYTNQGPPKSIWTRCLLDIEIQVRINKTAGNITMTSWWARWRLKSPASRLLTQPFIQAQIKENIKAPRHWPLCHLWPVNSRHKMASNVEYVSIWWRHHESSIMNPIYLVSCHQSQSSRNRNRTSYSWPWIYYPRSSEEKPYENRSFLYKLPKKESHTQDQLYADDIRWVTTNKTHVKEIRENTPDQLKKKSPHWRRQDRRTYCQERSGCKDRVENLGRVRNVHLGRITHRRKEKSIRLRRFITISGSILATWPSGWVGGWVGGAPLEVPGGYTRIRTDGINTKQLAVAFVLIH